MDKDTMVEALKFLNYSQLAKSSLVSKRFRNLIQIHRHYLARLYVDEICFDYIYHIEMAKMNNSIPISSAAIKVYDKELSPEEYDEWVICNNYSKQVPLEDQVTSAVSTQNDRKGVYFSAYAYYKDPNNRGFYDRSAVLIARVEFRDENWPLFQHFVRLVTDPLIYINRVHLAYQIDVLNLLAIAINSDHNRLQCKQLNFDLEGNFDKSITWIKNYVRCNRFYVYGNADLNHDEAFLDFFLNGGNCTSFINVGDPSKSVVDFMRKFMNLKNIDEIQLVEAIEGRFKGRSAELLNRNYAQFIVKEERHHYGTKLRLRDFTDHGAVALKRSHTLEHRRKRSWETKCRDLLARTYDEDYKVEQLRLRDFTDHGAVALKRSHTLEHRVAWHKNLYLQILESEEKLGNTECNFQNIDSYVPVMVKRWCPSELVVMDVFEVNTASYVGPGVNDDTDYLRKLIAKHAMLPFVDRIEISEAFPTCEYMAKWPYTKSVLELYDSVKFRKDMHPPPTGYGGKLIYFKDGNEFTRNMSDEERKTIRIKESMVSSQSNNYGRRRERPLRIQMSSVSESDP